MVPVVTSIEGAGLSRFFVVRFVRMRWPAVRLSLN